MHSYRSHQSEESGLSALLRGETSPAITNGKIFEPMMRGNLTESTSRALLVLLANKEETTEELYSAWKAIRLAEKSIVTKSLSQALDTCGTGGDGSDSINLSTLSSFVMAAAGVKVIKHGNRAITSRCGSSDLLEAFGMNLNQKPDSVIASAQKNGLGYFHAPNIHPVYQRFHPLRKGLRTRTLFNLLGPVLNPVAIDYQILGIASENLLAPYAELLLKIGRQSALIVLGPNKMDEITTLGPSRGLWLHKNKKKTWGINPAQLGFKKGKLSELKIQSVAHSKSKSIELLKRHAPGTIRDSVVLSAACGIWLSGKAHSIQEGIASAKQVIDSGKAWSVLNQTVKFSNL